jgi:chemotaxis protein MotB
MPDENALQPVIIVKKKGGHGGHHGGAWKVAYADFVTAMMAFFLVMWLLNAKPEVKEAVGGYFRDPTGSGKMTGSSASGAGSGIEISKDDMGELKDKLEAAMKEMPAFQELKDQVNMTVTGEGLRVELLETDKGMFFASGSPEPSSTGVELLRMLANQLGQLPNNLLVEGHTDAKPFAGTGGYSNWELSTDRANSARHLMEATGLRPNQITQVRGFADRRLRMPEDPVNASNRRISVIVQYLDPPKGEHSKSVAKPEAQQGSH